ncbi:MAG: hypothetical protein CL878_07220 [Dehalococcoidia bacterium]|nr:hypothetical protein [Dehalococcoidia bacterium]
MTFAPADRVILRELAQRVAEIADDPEMTRRRRLWVEHNSLRSGYPMMLVFPEGAWVELLPGESLTCESERAKAIELDLRRRIYGYEHFSDDTVVEKEWLVGKHIASTGWGLEPRRLPSPDPRGAWLFDPVVKSAADLERLEFPEISYDEQATLAELAAMEELFGDVLEVELVGVKQVSYHLMKQYTGLRGLEEVMVDMYAEPRMLHDAMALLEEGHRRVLQQYVDLNLLTINNDNTYHSSGGNSFTDQLPLADADADRARPCDMWASAEAQEMAEVSPEHHAEFVLPYECRLLEPFGLTGYGCCEDLTRKLDDVCTIPHLRRISISPFADVELCAPQLKGDYVFSWKPNPAHLVGDFDGERVREYVRGTVRAAAEHGCVLEMILKDTHTCEHETERFDQWTRLARQVILEEAGDPPS